MTLTQVRLLPIARPFGLVAVAAALLIVTACDNKPTTPTPTPSPAAPTVSGVSPATGSSDGGTALTIAGTGFQAGATLSVGGAVANATVVSPTAITATTLVHTPGAVDVIVTNPTGLSGRLSGAYTYACSGALINAVVKNNSACVEYFLGLQSAPATGEGLSPISPLVAAATLGQTSTVQLLLPKFMAHRNVAAVASAGGRHPDGKQRADTIEFLAQQGLTTYAGSPTRNFALAVAILRNQNEVITWLRSQGTNAIPSAFTVALNNPMNTIDDQLAALGVP